MSLSSFWKFVAGHRVPCSHILHRPLGMLRVIWTNPQHRSTRPSIFSREPGHTIYSCSGYDRLLPKSRLNFVKDKGAFINCLSSSHHLKQCFSKARCQDCHEQHHTSLHTAYHVRPTAAASLLTTNKDTLNRSNEKYSTSVSLTSAINSVSTAVTNIVLATALAKGKDAAGRDQIMHILFDSGSHASFITESCIQRLGLPRTASSISVTGIGGSIGERTRGEAVGRCYQVNALVLRKITNDLPTAPVQGKWTHVIGLNLADPHYGTPGPIDVLIGVDQMGQFLLPEMRKGEVNVHMAQNTVLGWVLFGAVGNTFPTMEHTPDRTTSSLHCCAKLDTTLRYFWEIEELPEKKYTFVEELACEDHFDKTHTRASDGRFIVELPIKVGVTLGDSRDIAVTNFLRMEKRLQRDVSLCKGYQSFMEELLQMGHMEHVPASMHDVYYMPHHAVIKENSETTKIRVVFNEEDHIQVLTKR